MPNETMSDSESSSMPNFELASSQRASRPSKRSHSAPQNSRITERSNWCCAAATMPEKPNAMLANVTAFGTKCFALTAIHATHLDGSVHEDRARISAHL